MRTVSTWYVHNATSLPEGESFDACEKTSATGLTAPFAVTTWLEHREWPRRRVATALGISEASVRNHLNHARRKLLCGRRRGPQALAARLRAVQQRSSRAW